MKQDSRRIGCLLLAGTLLALLGVGSGCGSLSSRTVQYIGAPKYSPTDSNSVQILQAEPTRPYARLGEIVLDVSINPPPKVEKIEARIRERAAGLGADAAFLVQDDIAPTGARWWGPYWAPSVTTVHSRVVVAVAIKYQPE